MNDKRIPVKIGLVGLGRAGWSMHTKELESRKDKFQIVAGCDPDPERCQRLQEELGCRTYSCIAEMIDDPEVELVDIASRSPEHVEHALAALAAGKDVFLEKPIALTYPQALQLKTAAESSEAQIYFRHNRRFEPAFQEIRKIIASGILGQVHAIKLRRGSFQRRNDWQAIIDCGGGQLLNWGPHIVDHALQFLDLSVAEMWSDLKRVAAVGDAEDHLKIVLKGTSGLVVDLEISGGMALPEPVYVVHGNRGSLQSDERTIKLRYLNPKQQLRQEEAHVESPPVTGGFGNPEVLDWIEEDFEVVSVNENRTDQIWDHLYAAMREGVEFPIRMEEALAVMKIINDVKKDTEFTDPKLTY